jgi:hypothetical protein
METVRRLEERFGGIPREGNDFDLTEEQHMAETGSASFERHFQELLDPRVERSRKHPLINIVFMAVCGVLSGANSIATERSTGRCVPVLVSNIT